MAALKVMTYFKVSLSTHNWDRANLYPSPTVALSENEFARLFKEWKSHNRLKGIVTGEKAIAEGLVWTNLLSLVMKRRVVQSVMTGKLSMLKASKNSTTWWLPLLEAAAHRALTEIRV